MNGARLLPLALLVCFSSLSAQPAGSGKPVAGSNPAVSAAASVAPGVPQQPGMVVKADQEAPLVLFILPWHEPKQPAFPAASMEVLWPRVLDHDRSFVDEPINRRLEEGLSPQAGAKTN